MAGISAVIMRGIASVHQSRAVVAITTPARSFNCCNKCLVNTMFIRFDYRDGTIENWCNMEMKIR